ncbi:hypothetical protein [Clostridium aminobutyricum]|uniref:Uncharacterized protein n=1 Tax=Clostridium aminobutyricum TaxID=33953 RepID=A0A939IJI6_CLOAM|nr:hypothetical protein [Clostridium aminobutyricum]MBN7774131.1 hypothetical protein [Clostridium aminobutyricum]
MISAVNTNLNQLTSELAAAKQSTKVTISTEGKEEIDNTLLDSAPAPETDTLEISPEGYAALAAETSSDASISDSSTSSDAAAIAALAPEDSTDSSTSKNLSSYSEEELDQLAEEGSITEIEKNTELARRAIEEQMKNQHDEDE